MNNAYKFIGADQPMVGDVLPLPAVLLLQFARPIQVKMTGGDGIVGFVDECILPPMYASCIDDAVKAASLLVLSAWLGGRQVVEDFQIAHRHSASMLLKPTLHLLIMNDDVVGMAEPFYLLIGSQLFSAERAQIMNESNSLASLESCYAAQNAVVFLERVLNEQQVSFLEYEQDFYYTKKFTEKA